MGCSSSSGASEAPSKNAVNDRGTPADKIRGPSDEASFASELWRGSSTDPRWDFDALYNFLDEGALKLIKIGYLRQLFKVGGRIPYWSDVPPEACFQCAPPRDIDIYYIESRWLGPTHQDPEGEHLRELIEIVDNKKVSDSALVHWDQMSFPSGGRGASRGSGNDRLKAVKADAWMATSARIKTIILMRSLPRCADWTGGRADFFQKSGWCAFGTVLATYCRPIVNGGDDDVKQVTCVDYITDTAEGFLSKHCTFTFSNGADFEAVVRPKFIDVCTRLLPVHQDADGFRFWASSGRVRWVKVKYVYRLAAERGPFPRYQELPEDAYEMGVPKGRKFTVSYPWRFEYHPDPTGTKMQELADALRDARASPDDNVFLDYMSGAQQARKDISQEYLNKFLQGGPQPEPTKVQSKGFSNLLTEINRAYAYEDAEVVVLPKLAPLPAAGQWGKLNEASYEDRGWCATEFAIAKLMGRIANLHDPEVQRVDRCRSWPRTLKDFQENLSPPKTKCTAPGDAVVVERAFFRTCFSIITNADARVST